MSSGSRSQPSRTKPSQAQPPQAQPSRTLPARPSLRHLKLEAKRRLAAGEFATLHDAQAVIAREHGLPGWARLKQACVPDSPALVHLRWIVERFSGADRAGWTPPGEDEFREHFDARFLAAIPVGGLTEAIVRMAAYLRTELVVIRQAPLEVQVQLAGLRYVAVADAEPPHRLIGLRGFVLGERITDPRIKAPPPARTLGGPPGEIAAIATRACTELGLPALLVAGGEPGRAPWAVAAGYADLDWSEPAEPGHRFPVPGVTALVTGTAVLRLVADRLLGLDDPANRYLRAVSLADDSVTVRELLSHTAGVDSPARLYADSVPELAELMSGADLIRLATGWPSLLPAPLAREALTPRAGPGPAGIRAGLGWLLDGETAAHGGAGLEAVTLLRGRVRDQRSYVVLTSRAVTIESLDDHLRRSWLGT